VSEAIDIARAKNKASAQLERILAKLVLVMASGFSAFAAREIIFSKKMQKIARAKFRGAISLAPFVHKQRERDAGFFAKNASVMCVTEADGCQRSAFFTEGFFVFAQLRDMLTAKDSTVMAQKNNNRGVLGPKRAEPHRASVRIGQNNFSEPAAQRCVH